MKNNWKKVKLDYLGSVNRGKSKHRPRNDESLFSGKYPFIQTGDVKFAEFYISEYSQTYNEKGLSQSKLWPVNTLCITIAANIADSAILKIPACFPDSIIGFTANPKKSDVRFVKYAIDNVKKEMRLISKGTTQDNLSVDKILSIPIYVPSVNIQQKISSIISAYDDLIEVNNKRIKILEEMAQRIYNEWFVEFKFPGHEKVKIKNGVPEGWRKKNIGEEFTVVLGGTPSRQNLDYWTDGSIPWVNSGKVNDLRVINESELITEEALLRSSAKMMPLRTTLLAITGATLGQVSLLEIECSANQSVVGIFDPEKTYNEYIFLMVCENINKIIMNAGGGAQQHINKEIVKETKILIPDKLLIEKFNEKIIPIFDLISCLLFTNNNLRKTRDVLLPKLMNKEIKVE